MTTIDRLIEAAVMHAPKFGDENDADTSDLRSATDMLGAIGNDHGNVYQEMQKEISKLATVRDSTARKAKIKSLEAKFAKKFKEWHADFNDVESHELKAYS
jgi:predicted ATPase